MEPRRVRCRFPPRCNAENAALQIVLPNDAVREAILASLDVLSLLRLRRVARALRDWADERCEQLPRATAVGSAYIPSEIGLVAVAWWLDWRAMRWWPVDGVPLLNTANFGGASLPSGGAVVVGGHDVTESSCSADMEVLGTRRDAVWEKKARAPTRRSRAAVVALPLLPGAAESRVVVLGGSRGSADLDLVELCLPESGVWRKLAPMLSTRHSFAAACTASGSHIVVAGGFCGSGIVLGSVELYSLEQDEWTEIQSMESPRAFCTGVMLPGDRFVVVGGEDGVGRPTLKSAKMLVLENYDGSIESLDEWRELADMHSARSGAALSLYDEHTLLVVGGEDFGASGRAGSCSGRELPACVTGRRVTTAEVLSFQRGFSFSPLETLGRGNDGPDYPRWRELPAVLQPAAAAMVLYQ